MVQTNGTKVENFGKFLVAFTKRVFPINYYLKK
jgi:hypothetical protein